MTEKLQQYEGCLGQLHRIHANLRENWTEWRVQRAQRNEEGRIPSAINETDTTDIESHYTHIGRRKSRMELVRISAAVMGIEFSYAAETAFVSPTLLKIGVTHNHMTLVWALSPLIGFFLTPIFGSMSDQCSSRFGRRRPFIVAMSFGIVFGLLLVPNGELLGYAWGDVAPNHSWGIIFTVIGTALLDFNADACQSPSRAYLLDVTLPDDHARGLSTFTIMAGLGGFFGYSLGGINWDATSIGNSLGGHVRAVFTLVTVIFIVCVTFTVSSFKEIPLHILELLSTNNAQTIHLYGTLNTDEPPESPIRQHRQSLLPSPNASLSVYLKSIILMPKSIRMVCLTNLFCWMAHVCYSLYFTDFVGEAVFGGNPTAVDGHQEKILYEDGVRFGCWGMSLYSLSCACYSTIIERLMKKFGTKRVYVGGLCFYSTGMFLMAITKLRISVLVFSATAGVMYSTLFTMPYLLIAHYHATGTFHNETAQEYQQIRGLGTDVAIVSSMVFLAQFTLSLCLGTIVSISGTTTAVVSVASALALCGAFCANHIMYLDL